MDRVITPAGRLAGVVRLPGDKSISHRYALLAALAEGSSVITNFSSGADCRSTLGCLEALGVPIRAENSTVRVEGVGLDGLKAPAASLDAGNSGSTIRMLAGILAAQPFTSRIAGDESLARRPMRRIIEPLARMGARIEARDGNFPPLRITGGPLRAIDYELPVPSAQVKTAVLLAGLYADGATVVREAVRTRDHTEIALAELGAKIETRRGMIRLEPRPTLRGRELLVPSDLSSAAFFLVAALLVQGSEVVIQGVGLNPTRSALLDVLVSMGAQIKVLDLRQHAGELIGDVEVRSSPVRGGVIEGATTAAVIDEIPVLAMLGAVSENGLVVRNAAELRIKETDRIATVADNLGRLGVNVKVHDDGLEIPGKARFRAAEFDSFGDHRIAMACAVAALVADGPSTIRGAEAASVSFPEFYDTLDRLRA
ncbi:MAG: 3-phosphoshikimate 1-carboxyvinyltransferase [Acidobacteria bacterium]|nr:3-phosphoshikimate 1-carboxyvinyltransferase [Acidobacteriota bacterium]